VRRRRSRFLFFARKSLVNRGLLIYASDKASRFPLAGSQIGELSRGGAVRDIYRRRLEWGRLEKSPKLTAICDGRNFSSSSSFAPRELGRGRPGRSTIIIIARRVRSRVHPLRLRDRCGVTAISVILPTLLYVSNVVVSPRIDEREREREREREVPASS